MTPLTGFAIGFLAGFLITFFNYQSVGYALFKLGKYYGQKDRKKSLKEIIIK